AEDGGLVAVLGASGSGKSSVVRAGLLPCLAAGVLPGSDRWPVLATAPSRSAIDDIADRLDSPTGLIVVDQFEEAFTALDEATRTKLVDVIVEAVRRGHRVVLTIRPDFFAACAVHPELAVLVSAHAFLLGPLTAEQLRRTVSEPARTAGLTFEEG